MGATQKCYMLFQTIQKATHNKIATVQPLTSHLANHLRQTRHARYFWKSKDKLLHMETNDEIKKLIKI